MNEHKEAHQSRIGTGGLDVDASFITAGVRAREAVMLIERAGAAMRLAAFRSYLSSAVRSMPAILPSILEANGSDLRDALLRLRPDAAWPRNAGRTRSTTARVPPRGMVVAFGKKRRATLFGTASSADPLRMGGTLIRQGTFAERVEVVVRGCALEVSVRAATFELNTKGGKAGLRLPTPLPEVIVAAGDGRPLDDVVDLPVLSGRGYRIAGIRVDENGTSIGFEVGRLPVDLPWSG